MRRSIRSTITAAITATAVLASSLIAPLAVSAPAAQAADAIAPIAVETSTPDAVLYGRNVPVTVTATNPEGPNAYNLSFREVLPADTTLGTSTIAGQTVAPTSQERLGDGRTVVTWANVADLLQGATVTLDYEIVPGRSTYVIDRSVGQESMALASTNARMLPSVDDAGTPTAGTSAASDTAQTTIAAFEIAKSEPSPESELLRGAHARQTVYTLTVTNNDVVRTSGFSVVDYLPAGLEFLGCGVVDNTPGEAPEYEGAGSLAAERDALEDCIAPSSVTSVQADPDGDGPLEAGVYTRVEWDSAALGSRADLAAAGTFRIQYVAAVPMFSNVVAELDAPTANLANNSGTETADEQQLVNGAVGTGTTSGSARQSWDTHTVTAEDIAIQKSVDEPTSRQGRTSIWTLDVQTSEYTKRTRQIVIEDALPSALEYRIGSATLDGASLEPQIAIEGGSQILTWTLDGFDAPNQTAQIRYETTTRVDYRGTESDPIAAGDEWTNRVRLSTTAEITYVDANGVTTTRTTDIGDDSAAGQSTARLEIVKDVSAMTADRTVDCSTTDAARWVDEETGFTAGDTVCWRVAVQFQPDLHTLDVRIRDLLPAGFELDSWAATAANTATIPDGAFSQDDDELSWNLGTVAPGQRFEVVIRTTVTGTGTPTGDITANLAKLSYVNTTGALFQSRAQANAELVAPVVTIAKTPTLPAGVSQVRGDDEVDYAIVVTNTGRLPTLDGVVEDVLPTGVEVTAPGTATSSTTGSTTTLRWTGIDLAPGASQTLTYTVRVLDTVTPGQRLTNTATLQTYDVATNDGGVTSYPVATPASSTIAVVAATTAKAQETSVAEAGNDAAGQATIGETISYTVTGTIPAGTTVTDGFLRDTLPTGITVAANTLRATLDGADVASDRVTFANGRIEVRLPAGAYTVPRDGADSIVTLTFDAVVDDVSTNEHGDRLTNRAQLRWTGNGGTNTALQTTTIVEPLVGVAKSVLGGATSIAPGDTVTYELVATNAAGRATAHEVVVTDTMPVDITPLGTDDEPLTEDGTTQTGGAWDESERTITWTVGTLAPGSEQRILVPAVVANPLTNGARLTNEVEVVGRSTPGTNLGGRDADSDVPGYEGGDDVTVDAPGISLVKSATLEDVRVGETIGYTLTLTIPANTQAYDLTVVDTLPEGIVYGGGEAIDAPSDATIGMQSFATRREGGTIGFFLGDIAAEDVERTVIITYTGYAEADVDAGSQLRNVAIVGSNLTNEVEGEPAALPTEFTAPTRQSSEATVEVVAPALTIDKGVRSGDALVESRRAKPGETLEFVVSVTNEGNAPAYDVLVTDALDELARNLALPEGDEPWATLPDGVAWTEDDDHTTGTLGWMIDEIAPTETVTVTYRLVVPAGWNEQQAAADTPELVNEASALGYGLPKKTRDQNERDYPVYPTGDAKVTIDLDLASIGDTVWYDVNGDGTVDTDEPRLARIPVTVTYLGDDGVPGGGDDEAYTTVTDERGEWIVDRLPAGEYVVTVDAAAVAAAVPGLVPSHDGVGQTDAPDGAWVGSLGEADARRDLEIGFRGVGAVGSLVWFDQDADGVQDTFEPGLPGVRVQITWQGARDMAPVRPIVVTDRDGRYSLDGLPFGVVDVQVLVEDSAALDTYEQVSAVSNATLDGTSRTTLTVEAPQDLDVDFGYAGSHSLGDYVWLDQDGDGVRQPTESGLAGVELALTFIDLRGVESTVTTRTGADGGYRFDNLPAGDYEISVVNGLLADVDNTGYPGPAPGSPASGTIDDGDAHDGSLNFGYRAESLLGQYVWLDLNGDGERDAGEPGLEGVTVTATGPQGAVVTTVTDEEGRYLFENLLPGTWTVTVGDGLPGGVIATGTREVPGTSTTTLDPSLEGGMQDLLQDFGYVGSASLDGTVWLDQNADGKLGESGLEGVTVTLTWQRGEGLDDVVLTAVTAADGTYGFAGLPAGTYLVRTDALDAIDGIEATFDLDGGVETPGEGGTVALAAGETRGYVDFGYRGSASIGDLVWLDRDASGTAEGELGLAGVTVTLTWQRGGELADVVLTTVTDADGGYDFGHLASGDYVVRVDATTLPAGLAATFDADEVLDDATTVTVAAGDVLDAVVFGYRGAGTVGDRVWLDLDGLGDQGETEPGIPGQAVELTWLGRDGEPSADDLVFTTTTGIDGAYGFEGLPDGAYVVRVAGGVVDRAANTGNPQERSDATAMLLLGDATGRTRDDQDFGFQGEGAIGDLVWWDGDGDGVRDESETTVEPGLDGVTVELLWFGPDGVPGTIDDVRLPDATTDATGAYGRTGLPSGSYLVRVGVGVPAGLAASVDAGDVESPDGAAAVTLDPEVDGGMVRLDQDFGFTGSGALGDLVWLDLDGDGERGDGEPGIEGVTVTVTWRGTDGEPGTGDERTWTTTVDDDGAWLVDRLPAGTFDVVLSGVPVGLVPSADPDGGDDAQATTTLEPAQQRDEIDFGFVGGASVGDTVWLDVDGDGEQSELEPGVAGVVVSVVSAGVDGVLDTGDDLIVVVETGADGRYLVVGLPTGATRVSYDAATLPAGTAPTVVAEQPSTVVDLVLEDGDARDDVDFPVLGTQSLEGVVWVDGDGDGVRGPREVGIPGVTVRATWDGPLGPITLDVVSDADGAYVLPNVPAGDWTVRVDLDTVPARLVGSTPAEVVVVVPIDGVGTVEHGLVPTGEVGDLVFHDEDRDGVQDAGERGIGGVTVQLVDGQGRIVAETVTAADGSYLFEDVAPGSYTVRVDLSTVPAGFVVTSGEAGLAVEVGPGQSVLSADFPLAAPVVAPLPRTGGELALALLGVTLLLLLAGAALLLAARRRRAA